MPDLAATPGQTVGPFFHYALPFDHDRELVPPARADAVLLHGHVYDGADSGLPDALLEIRQADRTGAVPAVEGSFRRPGGPFTGWGRSSTDRSGRYWFSTVEPGPVREGGAPFFAITVVARGVLNRLFTRAYVPGDDTALAADPLLASLGPESRARQIAVREPDGALRFDIHLQGTLETAFLSFPRHRD
jgi:protocatechuate 3,4-dioxygenase alpha subunit